MPGQQAWRPTRRIGTGVADLHDAVRKDHAAGGVGFGAAFAAQVASELKETRAAKDPST